MRCKPKYAGRTAHDFVPKGSHSLQAVFWTGCYAGSSSQAAAGAALENAMQRHMAPEKLLHGRATQRRECTGSEPDPRWAAGHSPAAAQLRPAGPPSQSGQQPLRLLPVSCLRPGTSGRPVSQGTGSPQQLCATWQLSWLGQSTSKPCKVCQAGNTLQSNTHPQPLQDCLIRCVSICLNCAQGNASIAPTPAALLTQC